MSTANLAAGVRKTSRLRVAHSLVAETAQEMAREFYEIAAHDNGFFKTFPDREDFVNRSWNAFANDARQTLVTMLTLDDVSQPVKDKIFDALLKDGAFNRPGPQVH